MRDARDRSAFVDGRWTQVGIAGLAALAFAGMAAADSPPVLRFPTFDPGVTQLAARREAQLAAASAIGVEHGFHFADRLPESGITFRHRATPDGTVDFKLVHYDHGTGLAVADVDGDDRPDLYFVNQMGANELWHNLGSGRFESWTERSGTGLADRVSVGATFADFDNDGDADLYVTSVRDGNVLFRNEGGGRFVDVTAESGVGYRGHSSGSVAFDYDRDGKLDLFVANVGVYTHEDRDPRGYHVGFPDAFSGHLKPERTEVSRLFRNLGGMRFEDVTESSGLVDPGWSGDAAASDIDGDGWLDLYVLNMQGDDRLWLNRGGTRFDEARSTYFPKSSWGAMGIVFFDADLDGAIDLFVTDMHSDMSDDVGPHLETMKSMMLWSEETLQGGDDNTFGNSFYRNDGAPPYVELSDAMGLENYWPWGVASGDLNADGWEDLFVTASMSFPFRYGTNSLLLNDRGVKFSAAEFVLGVEPRRDGRTHVEWMQFDCSGPGVRGHPFFGAMCGGRRGVHRVEGVIGSRSAAIVDLDGDGDLDIVTNELHAEPQILISDLAQRRPISRLEVRLVGTRSNLDGLGAIVRLRAGGAVLTQQHDGKSGYLTQSSLPLYFGLGDRRPEALEVRWPSGTVQFIGDPPASGRLEIVEPAVSNPPAD